MVRVKQRKQAKVCCVIIGFSNYKNNKEKKIFDLNKFKKAKNINLYLKDFENILVSRRSVPLCDVPNMQTGNRPIDGGHLLLNEDEKNKIVKENPLSQKWIRPCIGGEEFLNGKKRWCLWLVDANPSEIRECTLIMERIEKVKQTRMNSKSPVTQKRANTPALFDAISQPNSNYLLIPFTTSGNRKYIPMGFMNKNVIVGKACIIPNATLYHFGVLESIVHMAWMRAVAGRLKSDYNYSIGIVYNNFIWPNPTPTQKENIEKAAQAVLDARKLYSESTLADLYNPGAMPFELKEAHEKLDRAVKAAYGNKGFETEEEIVESLMKLYKKAIDKENFVLEV